MTLVTALGWEDDEDMPLLIGLWALTGTAWVVTFLGMFSIGIFVLPIAIELLVTAIVLTSRRPGGWPSMAGLGVALAAGLVWLGWIIASPGPSQLSCSGSSDGPTQCTSNGLPVDPNAVDWTAAAPLVVAAAVVTVLSVVAYSLAAASTRSSAAIPGR